VETENQVLGEVVDCREGNGGGVVGVGGKGSCGFPLGEEALQDGGMELEGFLPQGISYWTGGEATGEAPATQASP